MSIVSIPYTFTNGLPLDATQINANFQALAGGLGSGLANSALTNITATSLTLGTISYADTGVVYGAGSSLNGYVQDVVQNTNAGSAASADYVVSNNLGTAGAYYGDFGINSSTFSGVGSLSLPNATYVYSANGDLVLGSYTSNAIHFVVGNGATDAAGIDVSGNFTALVTGALSGSVQRTLKAKLSDFSNAQDFGVSAVGVDSTTTFNALNATFGTVGGAITFAPFAKTLVSDPSSLGYGINISNPIALLGSDYASAYIHLPVGSSGSTNTLTITPAAGTSFDNYALKNIRIVDPSTGTRTGNAGFYFYTGISGVVFSRTIFEGLATAAPASGVHPGMSITNNDVANPTGSYFCSEFRRNTFNGGLNVTSAGDSNLYTTNTFTGAGIGVEFTSINTVPGGAASENIFLNTNVTSTAGAFVFHGGKFIAVEHGNLEQTVSYTGSFGFQTDFYGDAGVLTLPKFTDTNSSVNGSFGLTGLVRMANTRGGQIAFNAFYDGGAPGSTYDIQVDATANDVWVGPNLAANGTNKLRILNNGKATRGVDIAPTLLNSWTNFGSGTAPISFAKSLDGFVTVTGCITGGTTTVGTSLFVLPAGFLPTGIMKFVCNYNNAGTPATVILQIDPSTGNVSIGSSMSTNTQLYISFSFRDAFGNTIPSAGH